MLSKINPLAKAIHIVPSVIDKNKITMPFAYGNNLQEHLLELIAANKEKEVIKTLDKVISLITSVGVVRTDPHQNKDYNKVFGRESYAGEMDCLAHGLIDTNLDNIIVQENGKWALIDYEWCFTFPVPLDFVIGRVLYNFFFVRYTPLVRHIMEHTALYELYPGNFVPKYIYHHYEKYFFNIYDVMVAESRFQDYVLDIGFNEPSDIYLEAPNTTKKHPILNEQQQKIHKLETDIVNLTNELTSLKNSRRYKYASKAADSLNKIRKPF